MVLCSGCIDTELGLDVLVTGGSLTVPTTPTMGSNLSLTLDLNVRVGTFALNGNSFSLQRASVFSGENAVAQLILSRPAGFDSRLEPGESIDITVSGTNGADGFPQASALCDVGTARVVVDYAADSVPDDPTDPPVMSIGTAEGNVTVTCN